MDQKIKEENKKLRAKFLWVLLGAGFLGGIAGVLCVAGAERGLGQSLGSWLSGGISAWALWLLPLILLPTALVHILTMKKVKAMQAAWDGEEEETPDTIDRRTEGLLVLQNVAMGLGFTAYSAGLVYQDSLPGWGILAVVGEFLPFLFLLFYMQKQTIEFVRTMNPEKKGSVFDLKFDKVWTESCDEGEKRLMGEAAYGTFRIMTRVCIGLWAVLIFLQMFAGVGLLPTVVVMGLFITAQLTYWLQVRKLTGCRR